MNAGNRDFLNPLSVQMINLVNDFVDADGPALEVLKVEEEAGIEQRDRVKRMRAERNEDRVEQCLADLRGAAERNENVIPPMLECARSYCTLFEMRDALEKVYGAFREPVFF